MTWNLKVKKIWSGKNWVLHCSCAGFKYSKCHRNISLDQFPHMLSKQVLSKLQKENPLLINKIEYSTAMNSLMARDRSLPQKSWKLWKKKLGKFTSSESRHKYCCSLSVTSCPRSMSAKKLLVTLKEANHVDSF